MIAHIVPILLLAPTACLAIFFGGSGCGCAQTPACPPPPPPQPCAAPLPCGGRPCQAKAARTVESTGSQSDTLRPLVVDVHALDELEMRAAAFGVPIGTQSQVAQSSVFETLHRLGDPSPSENNNHRISYIADGGSVVQAQDDDAGDLSIQVTKFGKPKEIRRAPTNARDFESSTIVADAEKVENVETTKTKCNSHILKKLMLENMSDNSSESKRKVNDAAETKFGGRVDVICSRGHFSYIFTSNLFCEATKGLTTCIAFRQAVI